LMSVAKENLRRSASDKEAGRKSGRRFNLMLSGAQLTVDCGKKFTKNNWSVYQKQWR